jgi:hypothetical protein
MAGKSDTFENDLLKLIFNATAIANIADNAASSPATSFYLALHTADPTDAGNQSSNECAYTSYAREAVARTSGGFTVSGSSCTLTANVDFTEATGGTETATHFSVGTAVSGTGKILYAGTITPNISISTGVTPRLTTGTTITED